MNEQIKKLVLAMQGTANPERAVSMKAYMKGQFSYLGQSSPVRKELQKDFFSSWKKDRSIVPMDLAKAIWNNPEREYCYVAMDWMKSTSIWKESGSIEQIEAWILDDSWWDTVDFLASTCVGAYFLKFPAERDQWIEKWNNSSNFWLNRTALIFQLKYKEKVDTDLLFALIDTHKTQKEFFIRKAIGWALRELSKTQPELVREYLQRTELSGLSIREASKYLPKEY